MSARSKPSTEGAEVQSVAETAQDGQEVASKQVATLPSSEPEAMQPGLPSPHQDHALNWMTEIQIKFDTFKAGHDALVAELAGKDNEYDAARQEKRIQFENDMSKLDENHQQLRETLQARINNMLTGMEVARVAVERYNEMVKPETKNLRGAEQQEQQA